MKTSVISCLYSVEAEHRQSRIDKFPFGAEAASCQLLCYKNEVKTLLSLWVYFSCRKACSKIYHDN